MANRRNGVDIDSFLAFVEAVKADRELSKVRFVAKSTWHGGTKAAVSIAEFYAGGQIFASPLRRFTLMVDEPAQIGGTDQAPNPIEYLAAALCGCLTAGIATNAALFETDLEVIDVTVEADLDVAGLLGLDDAVPTHCSEVRYDVRLKGPASRDRLVRAKETLDRKSPVRNTIEHAVRVRTRLVVDEA